MGTIGAAFNVIKSALDADQSALNIVANNVANANTPGYTREIANFEQNPPVNINGKLLGDGVAQTGPISVRDRVLEARLVQQQQQAAASGSRLTALNALQAIFPPDSGASSATAGDIGSDITKFFSSFSALEANPTDNALRQQILSSARTLAGDLSNSAAALSSQRSALDQEASGVTSQINTLTTSIAKLNQQIQSTSSASDAGPLENQRELDISQLSKLVGIDQITTENNGLSITTTAGQLLVSQSQSFQLTTGSTNGVTSFILSGSDITSQLASGGGQLGGTLTARDVDLPSAQTSLDQLAYGISTAVNQLNNNGTDLAGDTVNAGNIFNQPAQVAGSAANISVVLTDPNHIAAASSTAGTGDNSNAVALAALANQAIVNGQSPSNFFSQFVSSLGATVSEVQTENTAQNASVSQLQTQVNSLSGVSLNDEASSLQQFQRAYQAASEVFTILNQVAAAALNLGVQTAVA